ncbi:MAG: hypothetical protein JWQ14_515 [Adhaeribacter sp.]|nr:hypothetical protein [Adhaeribacter sp.]
MLYKDNDHGPQKITIDYRMVLNRLQKNIAVYASKFPEVAALKRDIDLVYFNILLTDAHLCHLQKICKVLDIKSGQVPVIKMLHQGFCSDLELFKRGATISQNTDIYS